LSAAVAVTEMGRAMEFHERRIGLTAERDDPDRGRAYACGERDDALRGRPLSNVVSERYHGPMAMTLRLTDEQTEALRARAGKEGRSMQQVARSALDEYLMRAEDDERTDRLAGQGARRFADLLRRLGE
jgi:plasmid stability protein